MIFATFAKFLCDLCGLFLCLLKQPHHHLNYIFRMKINITNKLHEIAGEKMLVMKGAAGADLTRVVMLNSSAEMLWNAFQGKDFEQSTVAGLLIQKYGISTVQAAADADAWISSLRKAGLVEI